ncbi:peptidoglycan-binding protein [Beduinella massiliensis]|uniref:peptidoglycan-binding protein n=1 Tax=Beduinella massiliensis TaxID=1852363 RepID=UPI0031F762E7
MSEKMRKMLALVCVAVLMTGTATLPAVADEGGGLTATPVEATDPTSPDGGDGKTEAVTPTAPISSVQMQVIDGNNLRVFGVCEKDQAVNVTLCDADGAAIAGTFNPHKVTRNSTEKGTFDTTFTGLIDGTYRVKVSYAVKNSFKAVEALTADGQIYAVTIAASGSQDNGSSSTDATTQPPAGQETSAPTTPAVTAPTTAISGVQASLSGTKDIAVSGLGEAGQKVIIQVYKGDEATDVKHTKIVGQDGSFSTKFDTMNPNDYRICAYYEAAPDQKAFADGVVSVGKQSQETHPENNGTSNGDGTLHTPSNDNLPIVPFNATGGDATPDNLQISEKTDSSATITGTATPNSDIEILVDNDLKESTKSDAEGKFSYTISGLTAGTYTVSARYKDQTSTKDISLTIDAPQSTLPDSELTITNIVGGEACVVISGSAKEGVVASIKATIAGQEYSGFTGTAEADGTFTVSIPVPDVSGSVEATAHAEVQNYDIFNYKDASIPSTTIEIKGKSIDLTVSAKYDPLTGKTTISGEGKKGAAITVKVGSSSYEGQINATDGKYTLTEAIPGEGDDMLVVVAYKDNPSITAETTVSISKPPEKVDLKITSAVGGVAQAVLTGEGKPNAAIETTIGGVPAKGTVGADGKFSLTASNVPKGNYKDITVKYTDENNGKSATWKDQITVTEPVSATDVTITKVTPEVGKVTIIGTAKAGERVVASMVTPDNKTVTRGIAVDANGSYTIEFDGLVSGTYKTLVVQYVNEGVGKQAAYPGDIAVPAPSVEKPNLAVDKIYTDTLIVVGKTTPNLKVTVSTSYGSTQYTYSQNSGSDGVFRIPLTRTQGVNAVVRVTVTYGNNETVYKDMVVEKTAQKPTYLTLSRYKGSRGQVVLNLQERLKDLGYSVNLTAKFDYATEEAVRQFQRTNGLDVDGIAGKNTQTVLYSVAARPNGSTTPDRYPVLVRGDRGSAVNRLQQRLKDLGYYTIKVDGIYGVGTQSAVRAFQRVNNLTQTGTANSYTQQVLYSSAAIPLNDYTSNYVYLSRGSRGSAVTRLQSRLAALGYYYGSLDGIYGSATQTAVRRFQSRNGISATGAADVNTQTVLFGSGAIANGSSGGSSVGYVYMQYGSRGTAVTRLQQALKDKGYLKGKVDGIYGDQTYDAVKAFQRAKGLVVDGIAGRKTQNALYGTNY